MRLYKKIFLTLAFTIFSGLGSVSAQIDVQNKLETGMSSDINSITIPTKKKKKKKKKKKSKITADDLKAAAEMKDNARYRKKRSAAGKKCAKAAVKKTCGNKKIEALLKKSKK